MGVPESTPVMIDDALRHVRRDTNVEAAAQASPRVFLDDVQGLFNMQPARSSGGGDGLGTSASAVGLSAMASLDSVVTVRSSATQRTAGSVLPKRHRAGGSSSDDMFFLESMLRVAGRPTTDSLESSPRLPSKFDVYVC